MYQPKFQQLTFENFHLPFGGKLDPENRWVKLADVIPWHVAETMYARNFKSKRGAPALTVRMALGSLIIKEKLGLSDIETVEQIKENPYLQFFISLETYQHTAPFDASMLTHFRKRLKHTDLGALQEFLLQRHLAEERRRAEENDENQNGDDDGNDAPANRGKLIVDATCAPADIAYPTDIGLLNDAREKTERIIDKLCEMHPEGVAKPRMSRRTARKDFLAVGMKKSLSRKALRKGLRKQLRYLRRNLQYIGGLSASVPLTALSKRLYCDLLVIDELYRQQHEMYKTEKKSISQPHVRPIERGKAAAKTEFGMKLSISVVDGISMPERMSWNAYNEGCDLVRDIERYRERYGHYPESVHADKIYRSLANRMWCKERGIRLSGVPLGRPPKDAEKNRARRRQIREDEGIRNAVEGKFGQAKRRYGLGRVMARLAESSLSVVSITFLVMNLDRLLAAPFLRLFEWLLSELDVIRNLFKWSSSRAAIECRSAMT